MDASNIAVCAKLAVVDDEPDAVCDALALSDRVAATLMVSDDAAEADNVGLMVFDAVADAVYERVAI